MHSSFYWPGCAAQLGQLPEPAATSTTTASAHGHRTKQGVGGEGVSNSPILQADCFALGSSTMYQAVEQRSSVKSTCKQVLPNTALACTPLFIAWMRCTAGAAASQLPPAPPLPNESAAFQAGLYTHQKTPIHVESCIKPTVRSETVARSMQRRLATLKPSGTLPRLNISAPAM